MKSLTAECLAPVLASGRRGPRESFDPQSVLKKRTGDVDIAKIGKEIRMPWEVDGRKWHLRDRLSRTGKPARWDGRILQTVTDAIEETEGFSPINWNAQYVVEATGTRKGTGWFLHAHTGEEWYTTLNFRVARNAFDEDELAAALALTDFDDLDDMPVYGRQARVRVRPAQAPWHEVVISLYKLEEVQTPEFQTFLKEAIQSYLEAANPEKLNLDDLTPWKKLGRKWHVMRKGFLQGKIVWEVAVIEQLFALLDDVWPDAKVDWSGKVLVNYRKGKERLGVVVSKRPAGVDLEFVVPSGSVPLGRVTNFGIDPKVESGEIGLDKVSLRFTKGDQVTAPALRTFLSSVFKTA